MSTVARQTSLLVAEDWKRVYQTFREADFQSYDFETLRKSMIDYLRLYYPEDFNDFIESSEYIALIDLIAFLGQSLAFRTDLNARENFLDTAERRDSVLRLARLVSYNPKRNISSSGLLKIDSITTSETLYDSNGINLANIPISWNDPTNANWLEQFTVIANATLIDSQILGKPGNTQTINGVVTEEYSIALPVGTSPAFPFQASVNDVQMNFEAVSATSVGQPYIYEVPPRPNGIFNILRRNDNQGNGSNNSGFFLYFKQGALKSTNFSLAESVPNRIVNVNYENINNNDVWLYNVTTTPAVEWKKVPAVAGVNVIYNKEADRNLFQINSRAGDQIDLVFGDGAFANVPQGTFKIYYRQSNGQTYKVTPEEVQGVPITFNYIARSGRTETLTIRASLRYTVTNSAARETLDEIRQRAPQQYYTQGRMITGEDYNIVPFTEFSNILKAKAVNRTSSGISRYLDVYDTSGKYSSTNIFAEDGHLYRQEVLTPLNFTFTSTSSVQKIVTDDLSTILTSREMLHFYYAMMARQNMSNTTWQLSSVVTNGSTGYFYNTNTPGQPLQVGYTTSSATRNIRIGATLKFSALPGYYFNAQNQMVSGQISKTGDKQYIYASVMQVVGDGTNGGAGNFENGSGPITLNQKVPAGAKLAQVIPVFKNSLDSTLITTIVARVVALDTFALRYDTRSETWYIVEPQDIGNGAFSESSAGNTTGTNADTSWLIKFEYLNSVGHTIWSRGLNYIFESTLETKFYFDKNVRVFDTKSGTTIHDQIKVLGVNPQPDNTSPFGVDYTWYIYGNIVETDGYENQNRVLVTFPDSNTDGIPDNPDLFETIVNPVISPDTKLVFFQRVNTYSSFTQYVPLDVNAVNVYPTYSALTAELTLWLDGDLFYVSQDKVFYILSIINNVRTLNVSSDYVALPGRSELKFQYRHNSPGYRRIDPSPNNIIDLFLLTKAYESDFRAWVQDSTNKVKEPAPPTTENLKLEYSSLENLKAISDTVVYNSAQFKLLFGSKAPLALQATFKVVKNPSVTISDNDVKSNVISAINKYFAVDNWDFGETFYFSELSAYLHSVLTPNVSSIIIVPSNLQTQFGNLYQINAEANEILASCATVDNVEIISAITAAQINMTTAT